MINATKARTLTDEVRATCYKSLKAKVMERLDSAIHRAAELGRDQTCI
jgi:hypothetical protein